MKSKVVNNNKSKIINNSILIGIHLIVIVLFLLYAI